MHVFAFGAGLHQQLKSVELLVSGMWKLHTPETHTYANLTPTEGLKKKKTHTEPAKKKSYLQLYIQITRLLEI